MTTGNQNFWTRFQEASWLGAAIAGVIGLIVGHFATDYFSFRAEARQQLSKEYAEVQTAFRNLQQRAYPFERQLAGASSVTDDDLRSFRDSLVRLDGELRDLETLRPSLAKEAAMYREAMMELAESASAFSTPREGASRYIESFSRLIDANDSLKVKVNHWRRSCS